MNELAVSINHPRANTFSMSGLSGDGFLVSAKKSFPGKRIRRQEMSQARVITANGGSCESSFLDKMSKTDTVSRCWANIYSVQCKI